VAKVDAKLLELDFFHFGKILRMAKLIAKLLEMLRTVEGGSPLPIKFSK
jgi:hypothetical protein